MKKYFPLIIVRKILFLTRIYVFTPVFIALLLLFSLAEIINAKDFGIQGNTYQISETDILKVIEERLKKIDMEQLNKKMATRTKEYAERPTEVLGTTKAKESKEYFYDPSYVLERDIIDQKGQIIHSTGTRVNPLEHIPLRESLIFINGDDRFQVDLALKIRQEKQGKLKIILIKGSPIELQREYKDQQIWFYFDQAGVITTKLGINEIPALVEQAGIKLKITILMVKLETNKSIGKLDKEASRKINVKSKYTTQESKL